MMNLKWLILLTLLYPKTFAQQLIPQPIDLTDTPQARFDYELNRIIDPVTNTIPYNELEDARDLMAGVLKTMEQIPGIEWKERGPNDIGGRTRALMFDPNDNTNKKVWAGGVAGGLWFNNDITDVNSSWENVFDFWDNMAVTCIAYDPSNTNIMYVGTGEGNNGGGMVKGGGIWKTSDGGDNWARLSSTKPDASLSSGVGYAFQYVNKIVVSSTGRVFAATRAGIWISNDQGKSFNIASSPSNSFLTDASVSDLEIGSDDVVYAGFGHRRYTLGAIYKTSNANNDGTLWTDITPPKPFLIDTTIARTEVALAPSTSGPTQVIYAISPTKDESQGYPIAYFRKSVDGGLTWTNLSIPNGNGTLSSIFGQPWWNLILSVHPTNANLIFAGGKRHARSLDGGATWINDNGFNDPVHADMHTFLFRPGNSNETILANDGGVYYSPDWGNATVTNPTFTAHNKNYNITQFYGAAMKNIANDGYLLGGTQDNNSLKINGTYNSIDSSTAILGGDGTISFIDQDNPGYQFVSTQFNNYHIADTNGNNVTQLTPAAGGGRFVNPADYHSSSNTLYTYFNSNYVIKYVINSLTNYTYSFFQINLNAGVEPSLANMEASYIKAGRTPNTVYVGTTQGFVFKYSGITDTENNIPVKTTILTPYQTFWTGTISSIDFGATENEILITKSNYNGKTVFYSSDGGANWISKDEASYGLPNIPVRHALINPLNPNQVLLATELGVWSTNNIQETNPKWAPTNANLAHVRCERLNFRTADSTVLVATHGRGLFTTKLSQTNPCQTVMTLLAPYDNKTTGTTTFNKTKRITATNQISGNANVIFNAGDSIELLPVNTSDGTGGFLVEPGSVFYAYITGCEN